jgi:membrane associated rhomboid family serine protease
VLLPYADDNPTRRSPIVTIALIVACCATFLYQLALDPRATQPFVLSFGAIPGVVTGEYELSEELAVLPPYLTLVSSMFLHGGWMHLLGNMMFLWIFGNNVEDSMGRVRFVAFYVLCGVGAAATHIASTPASEIPMIGASGAISGVLGAYFLLHPLAQVRALLLFFVITTISLPAWVFLGYWFVTQAFNVLGGSDDGVAWWAHLGGFVVGAALIPLFKDRAVSLFASPRRRGYISRW